jgi:hypothetical protein
MLPRILLAPIEPGKARIQSGLCALEQPHDAQSVLPAEQRDFLASDDLAKMLHDSGQGSWRMRGDSTSPIR